MREVCLEYILEMCGSVVDFFGECIAVSVTKSVIARNGNRLDVSQQKNG